jgi:hypothetical protein
MMLNAEDQATEKQNAVRQKHVQRSLPERNQQLASRRRQRFPESICQQINQAKGKRDIHQACHTQWLSGE